MSTAIEHLVKGEVMQMRPDTDATSAVEFYLRKNYYKTGSLMAHGCQSALEVAGHSKHICTVGHAYGRHVGLAFQVKLNIELIKYLMTIIVN